MKIPGKHVAIVGAGVAGLTAAADLAAFGATVSLFDTSASPGGHALQLNCKAAPDCVKCGACVVEQKLLEASGHDRVQIHSGTRIDAARAGARISLDYSDSAQAPEAETQQGGGTIEVDAVLVATGFAPYNPTAKPYGYGHFQNVITSLDAERRMRTHGILTRPSDGRTAQRIAFIQCVGSRDAHLGHVWCSKICCGSSLRMARLVQSRQLDAEATCFYIDVQTFGKDFHRQLALVREGVKMVRAIPGDILGADNDDLTVTYFDTAQRQSAEARFDLIVLSIGLAPSPDNARLAGLFDLSVADTGFLVHHNDRRASFVRGVFTAGSVLGPMSIPEAVGSAEQAVWDIVRFLCDADAAEVSQQEIES